MAIFPLAGTPFSVSDDGAVYRGQKRLKGKIDKLGYVHFNLRWNGKRRFVMAHTLVLEVFVGPKPAGMECRHLDGNPGNNFLTNICWGTKQQNVEDKIRHGTIMIGKDNPTAKLCDEDVIEIRRRVNEVGESAALVSLEYGMSLGGLRAVCNGSRWKHLPGSARRKPGPRSR